MSKPSSILQVAVPGPFSGPLDYLPPSGDGPGPLAGARVRVPLGSRREVGVITGLSESSDHPRKRLRPAIEILDQRPLLDAPTLGLAQWAARYYHHPIGEVLAGCLPTSLRRGQWPSAPSVSAWRINDDIPEEQCARQVQRSPRQAQVLARVTACGGAATIGDLQDLDGDWRGAIRHLVDKALLEPISEFEAATYPTEAPELNDEQHAAVTAICAALDKHAVFLLDGITGSGKTEVYLAALQATLRAGRQALVLVPEIGLTPQLVQRFRQRLGTRLAVMHSGLSDGDRARAWLAARDGTADVVIGTRSALFTPLARPGLLIVDEEHDLSFKQQDGFRYHARDLAVVRAHQLGVPLVLGSATPSLESRHNAQQRRYRHLQLNRRAGTAKPPAVHLLDLRGQPLQAGLSPELIRQMHRHLNDDGQVLLFLNRRGYAPVLLCHDCGGIAECSRCDARLTYHRAASRLRCHHCGYERPVDTRCGDCGSTTLQSVGQGTEQLESMLQTLFPEHAVSRIDRDTTRRQGAMEALLDDAHSGRSRILLGTQMLAKGHDLPDVSLVGILDCDQGLFGADFRATERMAQLIVQVSGRAGRAERAGEVLLQTHHPEHPLLVRLLRDGYRAFADDALKERQLMGLPPCGHLALLRAEAPTAGPPRAFLEQARGLGVGLAGPGLSLLGPVPAPMERRAGRFRAQLLVQCGDRPTMQRFLFRLRPGLADLPLARKVRWSLDVDPQDML
ncbi:primosomal protein N' [Methylonatrum kenyense]|uniref:primosomal protein N' n=1 Tax=Methylonatrum kenyense TaxID=455253 RepID=UPI0020BE92C1|nr:primosomal protein N' [Methylonatrum kenyense]